MIVKKSIEELMEDLGGYVSIGDIVVENIGNFCEERKRSAELTGKTDSTFDEISERVMSILHELGVMGVYSDDHPFSKYFGPNYTGSARTQYSGSVVDVFEEALGNSVGHGNRYDTNVLTSVKLIECRDGYIIRIRDSGIGFNSAEIARKREEGEPGSFRHLGEGFELFINSGIPISFENNNTTFNMVVEKSKIVGKPDSY